MSALIPFEFDLPHRVGSLAGEPMIFHCHHYNSSLQRTISDAEYIDTAPILVGAGAEVAFAQLTALFRSRKLTDVAERKALASEVYRWAGFGTFDLASVSITGGSVSTTNSHYAAAWKAKWVQSDRPVCFFASGWLAGAAAAVHDQPLGAYSVRHAECMATGAPACCFELTRGPANYAIYKPVGVGALTEHKLRAVPANSHDESAILSAVATLPLTGDMNGNIDAFGVRLTRHYANYYNRISFEFLAELVKSFGDEGRRIAAELLVEAGRVCAFNTYGGVMTSPEWDALIRPNCRSREDWVFGMVAVVNAFGWGRIQVTEVSESRAEFVVHDDYESLGYLAMFGEARYPVSFLAQGGAAGLMNLVYRAGIENKPALTPEFYEETMKHPHAYQARPLTSRAMGDEVTSFEVVPG